MKRPLALFVAVFLGLGACGSDDSGGGAANPCKISSGSDDCLGRGSTTVKYDCDNVADRKTAEGLGCVAQDPKDDTDRDVCCAPITGASTNKPPGSPRTIACGTKAGDDDCADRTGYTKKFDCDSAGNRDDALAAGCIRENADKPDSTDVCCPDSYTPQ